MKFTKLLLISLLHVCLILSCDDEFKTLKIISYSPANSQHGVGVDAIIEINFNNRVKTSDIESQFYLSNSSGNVEGIFRWTTDKSFTFTPRYGLKLNNRYTYGLPKSIRDNNNNFMDIEFIAEFYVGDNLVNPTIMSSIPSRVQGGATNIATNQNIIIQFDSSMNREKTESAFSISPNIIGYFEWSSTNVNIPDSCLTYILTSEMKYGTKYTVTLSTKAVDLQGNSIPEEYSISYITGNDFVPPVVNGIQESSAVPNTTYWNTNSINNNISKDISIAIIFSKPMDRKSTEAAFSIKPSVSGYFVWENQDEKLVFHPFSGLSTDTIYQLKVNTSAKDINGLVLKKAHHVIIRSNGTNSQYCKIGRIQGSNNDIDYITLYDINTSNNSIWPIQIEMGPVNTPVIPAHQDYFMTFEFISDNNPYTPVSMDKYSIFNNYKLESFGILILNTSPPEYPTGSTSVTVEDIKWPGTTNTTVKFKFSGLSNNLIHLNPILYKFTLSKGSKGIQDINKNTMKENFIIEFRE